jgi:hypothetical protein
MQATRKDLVALLAFVVMLAAVTLAPAADTIEELLQQDEASGQNDVLRPDLNALTEAQWEYYFKFGQQSDTQLESPLVERESEKPTRGFYIWVVAIAAGFGMAIGAIVAWPSVRRIMRTLMIPVQMEDLNVTIAALRRARRRTALMAAVLRSHPGDRTASECSSRIARWFGVRNWNALKINGAASPQTFC